MNVTEQSREQLFATAKTLTLDVAKNIDTEVLRSRVELAAIERHETVAAGVREKLAAEAELKRRLAEVKAESKLLNIVIDVPDEAKLADVIRLEKELGMKKKVPKPSPETLAIDKSKKVYAIFKNMEQEDLEILGVRLGGKHVFNFWPDKVHVLPLYLIQHYRSKKNLAGTRPHAKVTEGPGGTAGTTIRERRSRFSFEELGDAPDDAKFGIVTDEAVLKKLEQFIAA